MKTMRVLANRALVVVWSGVVAFLIGSVSSLVWGALLVANLALSPAIPWSVPVMAVGLALLWLYLGGRGWPRSTAVARRALLRARPVSWRVWGWTLLAGALSLVALAGIWIVLVELTGVGGNPTIPSSAAYPLVTVALVLLMGSLVSPLTEEAAFRGYAQVMLERAFPAVVAVVISSVFFALFHGPTQGFAWSKLLFYFLVGVGFGAIAYLTQSVLPAIPVHIAGDLTFFFFIWPHDAARPLVWRTGADLWFWLYVGQAILFTALAILAFTQLARATKALRSTPE
jgi:membrane protease YdiL (CAAX protease family)